MEVLVLILTLAGLAVGGDQFVRGAAAIGRRMGMSPILIGATIVAIGTSLPEWGVSVGAAWKGLPALATGNVVGSNVFNMCLILGLVGLIIPFKIGISWLPRDGMVMLFATFALLIVSVDGEITRIEGIGLLAMAILTLGAMIFTGRGEKEEGGKFTWLDIPRVAIGLPLIFVSSHFFVGAAESLALKMGINHWVIGITVAAMGTSLPELVTAIAAARRKKAGMVIGNLLGSNTMNIFFVLGSAGSIFPLSSSHLSVGSSLFFAMAMILSCVLLAFGGGLNRGRAAIIFLAGAAWYALELITSGGADKVVS